MITVKAKKQTELELKRRHKSVGGNSTSETPTPGGPAKKADANQPVTEMAPSIESESRSPDDHHAPISPKSSPIPPYTFGYPPTAKPLIPAEAYHHNRGLSVLSPQSAQSNLSDISDIFLAQTHRNTFFG
jgi:hypothetical protein